MRQRYTDEFKSTHGESQDSHFSGRAQRWWKTDVKPSTMQNSNDSSVINKKKLCNSISRQIAFQFSLSLLALQVFSFFLCSLLIASWKKNLLNFNYYRYTTLLWNHTNFLFRSFLLLFFAAAGCLHFFFSLSLLCRYFHQEISTLQQQQREKKNS